MTIHAQCIGDNVLVSRSDLEQLLELARRGGAVDLAWLEDDWPTGGLMRLAEQGGAFDFWRDKGEDLYSIET